MEWIFLDASGMIALLNKSDNLHRAAKQVFLTFTSTTYRFLTTDLVLAEVGNTLSQTKFKRAVSTYIAHLQHSDKVKIVYIRQVEFDLGLTKYTDYFDKTWGLTDCISFEVMNQYGCSQALTNDHHFTQAGFAILIP